MLRLKQYRGVRVDRVDQEDLVERLRSWLGMGDDACDVMPRSTSKIKRVSMAIRVAITNESVLLRSNGSPNGRQRMCHTRPLVQDQNGRRTLLWWPIQSERTSPCCMLSVVNRLTFRSAVSRAEVHHYAHTMLIWKRCVTTCGRAAIQSWLFLAQDYYLAHT